MKYSDIIKNLEKLASYCKIKFIMECFGFPMLDDNKSKYIEVKQKKPYSNSCVCGKSFPGANCAHYLSNWMILNGEINEYPAGCYCCNSGRPIRAEEMTNVFKQMGLTMHKEPPNFDCYIYNYNVRRSSDHVYYGTKTK
eukprot:jgi/Orpsp1_1/1184482/evm.model.c7180000089682.2